MQEQMPQQGNGLSTAADQRDKVHAGTVERLLALLEKYGWSVTRGSNQAEMSDPVRSNAVSNALSRVVVQCESKDQAVWFYGSKDYGDESSDGWRFIEKELMIPSAGDDSDWLGRIEEFWKEYVPIALNVRGDYAYLASNADGQIFEAYDPDLEGIELVAENFEAFVSHLERASSEDPDDLLFKTWIFDSEES